MALMGALAVEHAHCAISFHSLYEIEMIAVEWDSFAVRRQCGNWKRCVRLQAAFFMPEHLIGGNCRLDMPAFKLIYVQSHSCGFSYTINAICIHASIVLILLHLFRMQNCFNCGHNYEFVHRYIMHI